MKFLVALGAGFVTASSLAAQPPAPAYVPHRVVETRAGQFRDFEQMAAELARADVVFFGEQHDDPATHRMQLALLEALSRRRAHVVLSLEMFERDVRDVLATYLAGWMTEEEFLALSRPWPRYATDYRDLVKLARSRGWRVVAANVPRPMASAVARAGLGYLDTLAAVPRSWAAREVSCPENDDYFRRFRATMEGFGTNHGGPTDPAASLAALVRVYQAQCVKDETMAESIAEAWAPGTLVVHMNGAFHSDFHLGSVSRTRNRLPRGTRVQVITALPVADLDTISRRAERKRADWLVYVLRSGK